MAKGKVLTADNVSVEIPEFIKTSPKGYEGTPLETLAQASSVHLHQGVDLLGSKTSLTSKRGNTLDVTAVGVIATNGAGRRVLIYSTNIKGAELAPVK